MTCTSYIRVKGPVKAPAVCDWCGPDRCGPEAADPQLQQLFLVAGEQDSFGTEWHEVCQACIDAGNVDADKALEARIAEMVEKLGGPQPDTDFYVAALGNRDTVDECAIVKGAEASAHVFVRWEDKAADKGDYLYSEALRIATDDDRNTVVRFRDERADAGEEAWAEQDAEEEEWAERFAGSWPEEAFEENGGYHIDMAEQEKEEA